MSENNMCGTGNVGRVCAGCIAKRKAETQKNLEEKLKALDETKFWVKKAFSDGSTTEHMFVEVVSIDFDNKKLMGILDNDPEVISNVEYGQIVIVNFAEIEQIYAGEEK